MGGFFVVTFCLLLFILTQGGMTVSVSATPYHHDDVILTHDDVIFADLVLE